VLVAWTLAQPGNEGTVRAVNAVAGETSGGGLNDVRALPVTRPHVDQAIANARGGPVAEGSVGTGTARTRSAGRGHRTSSRVVPQRFGGCVLGVLVQTNDAGALTMGGAQVGQALGRYPTGQTSLVVRGPDLSPAGRQRAASLPHRRPSRGGRGPRAHRRVAQWSGPLAQRSGCDA
jgi:D-aminopeptidase